MKTYARVPVVPGRVAEVFVGEELFEMHGDVAATFHEAPGGTTEGDLYDGERFTRAEPPAVDPKAALLSEIRELESRQTPRRIREYALGEDGGWLKALDAEIAALRAKL